MKKKVKILNLKKLGKTSIFDESVTLQGKTVGMKNSTKLLEDIPNKIRDILGIIVDVNLHNEQELEFITILNLDFYRSYALNSKSIDKQSLDQDDRSLLE